MSRLVVNPNTPQAREILLKPGTNLLGRGFASDFKFDDVSVSSTHCEIIIGNGAPTIKDLGSTNGTFLNQAKIQEATLQNGQSVRLGGVDMVFYSDDHEPGALVAQVASPLPVARLAVSSAHAVSAPAAPPASMAPAIRIATPAPAVAVATVAPAATAAVADAPVHVTLPSAPAKRLSIAGRPASAHAVAPPAAESADTAMMEPPTAPPMAGSQSGPRRCKFHPKSYARWICHKCNRTFCDLCVISRQMTSGQVKKTCRSCGVEVMPLQVQFERPVQKGFFSALPGATAYPFRGAGLLILVVATIAYALLDMISAGWISIIAKIAFFGFLFLFMQNILHCTASDENEALSMPSMGDLLGGCFQLLGTVMVSFGLPIGLAIARFFGVDAIPIPAIIALAGFGCLYFPMAFLAVAMKDTVMAANPLIVLPGIIRAPLQYLVAAMIFMSVFVIRTLGANLTTVDFTTKQMGVLLGGLAVLALWKLASVYLLTVSMRVLGLFYNANKERLGWF